jgi:hypothetical protein
MKNIVDFIVSSNAKACAASARGNHAADCRTDAPVHVRHRRYSLVDEGQLRNVQKLLTRCVFERDALGPGLDGYAVRCMLNQSSSSPQSSLLSRRF